MSDIDPVEFGELRADVRTLVTGMAELKTKVESLQKNTWTARGILAGLTLAGGAVGGKLAEIFGGVPPSQQP